MFFGRSLFYRFSGNGERVPRWNVLWGIFVIFMFVSLFTVIFLLYGIEDDLEHDVPHSLLSSLPAPDGDGPFVIIEASSGEFPLTLARLLTDSATTPPSGASPIAAALPIFEEAGMSAMVIAERENGLSMYGAISPFSRTPDGTPDPDGAQLPEGWEELFLLPELISTDIQGVMELRAMNITSPLYFALEEDRLYVTDSLYDMGRIKSVIDGSLRGNARMCPQDCAMEGHSYLNDGGIIAGSLFASDEEPLKDGERAITLAACWNTFPDEGRKLSDTGPSGEAVWSASGLENALGSVFTASLTGRDWSGDGPFIPDPVIISLGFNLPAPGRSRRDLPAPLAFAASYLEGMELKQSEIDTLLTGPVIASLGGRTQILWYELPGLVVDLPDRGAVSSVLIDRFWTEFFSGIKPKPLDDYPAGGATDFPFSLTAVGDEKRAIIGLTSPSVEQNKHVKKLAAAENNAIGWLYIDLPRLSSSITDMPYMGELFAGEEGNSVDEEPLDPVHKAMKKMGAVFVSWRSAQSGRAVWYR